MSELEKHIWALKREVVGYEKQVEDLVFDNLSLKKEISNLKEVIVRLKSEDNFMMLREESQRLRDVIVHLKTDRQGKLWELECTVSNQRLEISKLSNEIKELEAELYNAEFELGFDNPEDI